MELGRFPYGVAAIYVGVNCHGSFLFTGGSDCAADFVPGEPEAEIRQAIFDHVVSNFTELGKILYYDCFQIISYYPAKKKVSG
jgi:hypothetical protein